MPRLSMVKLIYYQNHNTKHWKASLSKTHFTVFSKISYQIYFVMLRIIGPIISKLIAICFAAFKFDTLHERHELQNHKPLHDRTTNLSTLDRNGTLRCTDCMQRCIAFELESHNCTYI